MRSAWLDGPPRGVQRMRGTAEMLVNVVANFRGPRDGACIADARSAARTARAVLVLMGCAALGFGLLVYLADRDLARSALIPAAAALTVGPLAGTLGLWLPSFVHPFAFSLFTAAARHRSAPPAYGACAAWWAADVAFEVGQHPAVSTPVAAWLARAPDSVWFARVLADYFARGIFDPLDLLACTLGALAAAGVLLVVDRYR